MHQEVQWDALPSLALANIFCRVSIKDRSRNIPFVCKSWARAARHPPCWASMVADNHSSSAAADHAFVMDSRFDPLTFVDPFDGRRHPDPDRGVAAFLAFLQRAGGGAAITSIYFFPFLTASDGPSNDNAILRVIAQCCPNLKHFSFHGSIDASPQTIIKFIRSCKNLELVDFSDSPYFEPLVLSELSTHCPKLRGIRRNGILEASVFSHQLIIGFPSLKTLNLSNSTLLDKDLLEIVNGCKNLCYLDVRGCHLLISYMYIIKVASSRIASILYD